MHNLKASKPTVDTVKQAKLFCQNFSGTHVFHLDLPRQSSMDAILNKLNRFLSIFRFWPDNDAKQLNYL
jgi:hypothetical protein